MYELQVCLYVRFFVAVLAAFARPAPSMPAAVRPLGVVGVFAPRTSGGLTLCHHTSKYDTTMPPPRILNARIVHASSIVTPGTTL